MRLLLLSKALVTSSDALVTTSGNLSVFGTFDNGNPWQASPPPSKRRKKDKCVPVATRRDAWRVTDQRPPETCHHGQIWAYPRVRFEALANELQPSWDLWRLTHKQTELTIYCQFRDFAWTVPGQERLCCTCATRCLNFFQHRFRFLVHTLTPSVNFSVRNATKIDQLSCQDLRIWSGAFSKVAATACCTACCSGMASRCCNCLSGRRKTWPLDVTKLHRCDGAKFKAGA